MTREVIAKSMSHMIYTRSREKKNLRLLATDHPLKKRLFLGERNICLLELYQGVVVKGCVWEAYTVYTLVYRACEKYRFGVTGNLIEQD